MELQELVEQSAHFSDLTEEADVLQIFEGCLDAALLLARPPRQVIAAPFFATVGGLRNVYSLIGLCQSMSVEASLGQCSCI